MTFIIFFIAINWISFRLIFYYFFIIEMITMNQILFCLIFRDSLCICGQHGAVYLPTQKEGMTNRSKMLSGLTLLMLAFASSSAKPQSQYPLCFLLFSRVLEHIQRNFLQFLTQEMRISKLIILSSFKKKLRKLQQKT